MIYVPDKAAQFSNLMLWSCFQRPPGLQHVGIKFPVFSSCGIHCGADQVRQFNNVKSFAECKLYHVDGMRSGLVGNAFVENHLMSMYLKSKCVGDAVALFDRMGHRNTVSWNLMITTNVQQECYEHAFQVYKEMRLSGVKRNNVTFVTILGACIGEASAPKGKLIHATIVDDNEVDACVVVGTALLNMYGKCSYLETARNLFLVMSKQDMPVWNAMITVEIQQGNRRDALDLFWKACIERLDLNRITYLTVLNVVSCSKDVTEGRLIHSFILQDGNQLDVTVANALISMYHKCGSLSEAGMVFYNMNFPNVISWTSIIAAYAEHEFAQEALELFQQMYLKGVTPNKVTFIAILNACSTLGDLTEGKLIHTCISSMGVERDIAVGTALVNMYGRCGSVSHALRTFQRVQKPDRLSWSAMIAAYTFNGYAKEAFKIFHQMHRTSVRPDTITFLSILSACSHAGLFDAGWHHFLSISGDHGLVPSSENYQCMVDILGRVGLLDEAEDLIHKLPFAVEPLGWMILLGACKVHDSMAQGINAATCLLELQPQNSAGYVVLSNIYATASMTAIR